jgi:hypothetical protein
MAPGRDRDHNVNLLIHAFFVGPRGISAGGEVIINAWTRCGRREMAGAEGDDWATIIAGGSEEVVDFER